MKRTALGCTGGASVTRGAASSSPVAAGEAAAALAGASFAGGNEMIALSDGTHITFAGFATLAGSNFL